MHVYAQQYISESQIQENIFDHSYQKGVDYHRLGCKNQLMCAGVTAKSMDNFFLPSPECVIFRLDKELR